MKTNFSIGELSKLFNINTQTLRYYDAIGLFKPNSKNNESGYRNYEFEQIYKLASIRYLRKLGYSIDKIDKYLNSCDVDYRLDHLKEQSQKLHEKWDELFRIDNAIQRMIKFIESELPNVDLFNYCLKEYPERQYIHLGNQENLCRSDTFYFYPTIAFYKDENKWFGAYIVTGNDLVEKDVALDIIPAGKYYCGYHKGSHNTIINTINKLYKSANGKYKLSDICVNINIIDQFVENKISNFITEVQIRILE